MDKYIGRLLDDRYEILEVIGIGGMAVVYKAKCHRLNRLVAIKILRDDYSQDEEFRTRFHAESQAVAMLSHPNIVSVYDVSTSDDADYIVMELIDGITLKQYMEKKGVLNWKETLHFSIQIAKALEHAHSRGIIHRDIKPHNVMVLKNGSVKVADFGIAHVMSAANTLTKEALGSVHYISPEQARGGRVDNRSDIYSLGVVMYEMMTGQPPYDGESPVSIAIQHIGGNAPMPSSRNPNMPGGLEQIIMRSMALDPNERYATATEQLYDMDEFRKDPSILFDYNNSAAGMDDAVKLNQMAHTKQEQAKQPVERTTGKTEAVSEKNKTAKRHKEPPVPSRRHPKEEIVEEDNRSSKLATFAIILCSIVALVAIGIFLATLLSGEAQSTTLVTVPNLVNKEFNSDFVQYQTDIRVVKGTPVYNNEYAAGTIVSQEPKAFTQITKGSTVTVIVSLGPEPKEKKMESLEDLSREDAVNFLVSLGVNKDKILVYEESSTTIAKGRVTRTNPQKDEVLTEDITISIWVSSGPEIKSVIMPNVVGEKIETAKRILSASGLNQCVVEEVDSPRPAGEVLEQSVEPRKTINSTTVIVLKVSSEDNTELPVIPTVPGENQTSKLVTVEFPEQTKADCVVTVRKNGEVVEQRVVLAGTVSVQFELWGEGAVIYEIWVDDALMQTVPVVFVADGTEPGGETGTT